MTDVIIGVDIGINGGISFFDTVSKELLSVYAMPTKEVNGKRALDESRLKFILEIPKEHKESATICFENVHAFPGQGVVAVGTLMYQKGVIVGIATSLGYEISPVEPRVWQKHYELVPPTELKGKNATQTKTLRKKWLKQNSVRVSLEKFPQWETKIQKSDGIADSLLIGLYRLNTITSLDY